MENKICSECGKAEINAKNLCKACYSKMRRQTPEGKASLKKYNETKGKEAQKRWLSKQPKKEKIPKQEVLCECGKKSFAKGMCSNCYQRNYVKGKRQYYVPREKITIDYTATYQRVLDAVKKGRTILNACKHEGISSSTFYRNITPVQKKEINSFKSISVYRPLELFEIDDNIETI